MHAVPPRRRHRAFPPSHGFGFAPVRSDRGLPRESLLAAPLALTEEAIR
jgi:hypothetical protein